MPRTRTDLYLKSAMKWIHQDFEGPISSVLSLSLFYQPNHPRTKRVWSKSIHMSWHQHENYIFKLIHLSSFLFIYCGLIVKDFCLLKLVRNSAVQLKCRGCAKADKKSTYIKFLHFPEYKKTWKLLPSVNS